MKITSTNITLEQDDASGDVTIRLVARGPILFLTAREYEELCELTPHSRHAPPMFKDDFDDEDKLSTEEALYED